MNGARNNCEYRRWCESVSLTVDVPDDRRWVNRRLLTINNSQPYTRISRMANVGDFQHCPPACATKPVAPPPHVQL